MPYINCRDPEHCPEDALLVTVFQPDENGDVLAQVCGHEPDELALALAEAEHMKLGRGKQNIAIHLAPGAVWDPSFGVRW